MSQWGKEHCIHCGSELKTSEEITDNVCSSCATSLLCDDEKFEEVMDRFEKELEEEEE